MKQFACIWTNSYENKVELKTAPFFTLENGYDYDDLRLIARLQVGQIHNVEPRHHYVIRMNDGQSPFVKGRFHWDQADNIRFTGYHDPNLTWNGWAVPFFEKEVAQAIVDYDNAQPESPNTWCWEADTLVWIDDTDLQRQEIRFDKSTIEVDDQIKEVYAVGAYHWTWIIEEDEDLPF